VFRDPHEGVLGVSYGGGIAAPNIELLKRLDTLGEQRAALPRGPERRGVRREIKKTIRHPRRTT